MECDYIFPHIDYSRLLADPDADTLPLHSARTLGPNALIVERYVVFKVFVFYF